VPPSWAGWDSYLWLMPDPNRFLATFTVVKMAMVCFRGKTVAVEAAQTQAIQGRLCGQGRRPGEDRHAPADPHYPVNRQAQGKASQAQADIEEVVGRRELTKQKARAPALLPSSEPH